MASTRPTPLFTLRSVHGGARLDFVGDVPRGLQGYDGCTFIARLVGPPVEAAVEVYDIQPHRWSAFFRDLAANWRGWSGERVHESLEEHIKLSCTADRTGHVTVRVTLRGMVTADDWRAEVNLHLEAGQLDRIAREAAEYFGEGSIG